MRYVRFDRHNLPFLRLLLNASSCFLRSSSDWRYALRVMCCSEYLKTLSTEIGYSTESKILVMQPCVPLLETFLLVLPLLLVPTSAPPPPPLSLLGCGWVGVKAVIVSHTLVCPASPSLHLSLLRGAAATGT